MKRVFGLLRAPPDLAEYCLALSAVAVAALAVQTSPAFLEGDSYAVIRASIVAMPAAAAACCMAVWRTYNGSRVFGRSFLALGAAYTAVFAGEALYYFHLDPSGAHDGWEGVAEALFLTSYPLFVIHVLINTRYFAGRMGRRMVVPAGASAAVAGYVAWVGLAAPQVWAGALHVAASVALLGYAALAFITFRHTALHAPWTLLLSGITLGTAGDIMYRHAYALELYAFGDPSTGLWVASCMVVIYALYRHYRAV